MQIEPNHVITTGRVWRLPTLAHNAVLAALEAANVAPEPFEHARFAEAAACEVLRKAGYLLTSPHALEESSQAATRQGSPEKELLELHIEHEALLVAHGELGESHDALVLKFNGVVKAHNEKNAELAKAKAKAKAIINNFNETDKALRADLSQAMTERNDAREKFGELVTKYNTDMDAYRQTSETTAGERDMLAAENLKLKDALAGGTGRVGEALEDAARTVLAFVRDEWDDPNMTDSHDAHIIMGPLRALRVAVYGPVVQVPADEPTPNVLDEDGSGRVGPDGEDLSGETVDYADQARKAIDSAKAAGVGIDSAVTPEDGGPPQAPPVEVDKPDGEE